MSHLSGCCSQPRCDHLPAVCPQRSSAVGLVECLQSADFVINPLWLNYVGLVNSVKRMRHDCMRKAGASPLQCGRLLSALFSNCATGCWWYRYKWIHRLRLCALRFAGLRLTLQQPQWLRLMLAGLGCTLTFLVLDLRLHIVDCIRALDLKGDGLARQGLHKDLHGGQAQERWVGPSLRFAFKVS